MTAAQAADVVSTHEGVYDSHHTGIKTPCTVTEYDDGTWAVDKALGIDGFEMVWKINDDGSVNFQNNTPSSDAWKWWPIPDTAKWFCAYVDDGCSGSDFTEYNGSDIWFWASDPRDSDETSTTGFDTIYWDLPKVKKSYSGFYTGLFDSEPRKVTVEELDNDMVRVYDFYGASDYPLYVDLDDTTSPAIGNPDYTDETYSWLKYNWYYTAPDESTWAYLYVKFISDEMKYTVNDEEKTLTMPALVGKSDGTYEAHDDTLVWGKSSSIANVGADEAAGEAVYYNLQGVRVQRPVNGVFIETRGGKACKVMK